MKIRGDMSAVSKGPDRDLALLAAFLEATDKIDRRALQRRVALSEVPEAVNLEAQPTSLEANPTSLKTHPIAMAPKSHVASFTFRRANLVRA
jgi:hypothetical protein